jgi:hypothetical protein
VAWRLHSCRLFGAFFKLGIHKTLNSILKWPSLVVDDLGIFEVPPF